MGLLNPSALYFFAILPALILAYLARERPRQATVSSVLAFRALHLMRGERFGGRPRLSWPFFLELLILALAVLAMARPYLARPDNPIAVVIDDSAGMQVRMADGRSRFAAAIAETREALEAENAGAAVTLYLSAPQPHQMGPAFSGPAAAETALDGLHPLDAPGNPAALASLLTQLAADRHLARIIVASYRPIATPVPARLTPLVVGGPIANYAIGAFALSRDTLGAPTLRAHLTVANFSPAAQTLKVAISGDGKPLTNSQSLVAPGDVVTLEFPNLPPAQVYRAQLTPDDAFPLDNVAFATASVVKTIAILFVSPAPADGESLKAIPGVAVTTRTPDAYSPRDLAAADVAIFEYAVPKELPAINTLLVMPPPNDPIFDFAVAPTSQIRLTGWPTTDPITNGVNFRLLNLRSGEYLGEHPWLDALVSGAGGGLLLAGDRQGHRYLATGFNPLPYLGLQNLPMSILTLNLLGHLAGLGAQGSGFRTGEPWIVPSGVTAITTPSGAHVAVAGGEQFSNTDAQGIYSLAGPGGSTLRAVNLGDLTASDLSRVAPIKLERAVGAAPGEAPPVRTPLAPYVLAAIIALVALEALFVYRDRRRLVAA
ncbi:MAG TPA: BatA domain-containing protein [Candidatus Binataceae bacterium]|nr:BatA domain-containing protein [Candidatus Binataceae bacterium]